MMAKQSSAPKSESSSVRASTSSFFRTTTDSERMTLTMEESQSFACMKELADLEEQQPDNLPEESQQPSGKRQPQGSAISSTTPTESSVFRLKLFVILLLLCLTVAGAMLVHYITTEEEKDKFEYYYQVASSRLLVAVGEAIDTTLGGADAMAITMATYAKQSQSTWPFVTIPNFYLRCKKYASQSNAVWTTVYHLVPSEQREEWENYTATHNGWIDQDIAIQKTDPTYYGPLIEADQREDFNVVHGWDEYNKDNAGEEGTNRTGHFYLPNWQSAPVIPTYPIYNWDLMTSVDTSTFEPVLTNHVSIISKAYMLPDMNNQAEVDEAAITADWFKDYIGPDEDPMEPVSDVYYPVYKEMDESFKVASHDHHNHTLVAIVAESFYWRDVLKGILPEGTALDVVFENECCPTFTYRLDGGKVKYLGRGDQHERRYNDLEITAQLQELKDLSQSDYAGVPVDTNFCQFHFHIYPAPSMEERFASDNPAIFTAMTAIILSFTIVIFLLYDAKVGKRQRQTNRRLEVANEKLRHSSALQLQHFAMMSHEIRTPLNGILGMASLVEGNNLTPSQRESIKMIEGSGELLRRVVDDVLDYSKLAAGQQSIELARTSLQENLSGVLFSIQLKAESKGIKLKTVFDPLVPAFILTDGRRLQQILFNLLSNAVKFSPEKETVVLGAFVVRESKAHEQTLRIYVEDHGEGIHSRNFERIFQPFAQATVQTERIHGGTGLGLSITKKLVEALGGSIHVESELGKFARFSINLPLSNDDAWSVPDNIKDGTAVHLVCTNQTTVEQAVAKFQSFKLGLKVHANMESLESDEEIKLSDQRHVLLVDENLYTDQLRKRFPSIAKKWVLVTFGPHSKVDKSGSHPHIRSLEQTIPRSLMDAISEAIAKAESAPTIRPTDPMTKAAMKSLKSISMEQMRILVAEDNLVNQKVIARILQRIGIESVKVVENGQLAVDAEAEEPFDLVLMDREMPVMGGLEATKLIQSRPDEFSHPRAQVIFLTAHVTDDIKQECLEAGAINFLSKPCNLDDVKKCLHDVALSGGCNTSLKPPTSIAEHMKQEATVAA